MTPPIIIGLDDQISLERIASIAEQIAQIIDTTAGDEPWKMISPFGARVRGPDTSARHRHPSGEIVETNRSSTDTHVQIGVTVASGALVTVSVPVREAVPTDPAVLLPHALYVLRAIPEDARDGSDDVSYWGAGVVALLSTPEQEVRYVVMPGITRHDTDAPFEGLLLQGPDFHHVNHPLHDTVARILPTMATIRTSEAMIRIEHSRHSNHRGSDDPIMALRAVADLQRLMGDAS